MAFTAKSIWSKGCEQERERWATVSLSTSQGAGVPIPLQGMCDSEEQETLFLAWLLGLSRQTRLL